MLETDLSVGTVAEPSLLTGLRQLSAVFGLKGREDNPACSLWAEQQGEQRDPSYVQEKLKQNSNSWTG